MWKPAAASAYATVHAYHLAEWDRLNRAKAAMAAGLPVDGFAKPYGTSNSSSTNTTIYQGGGFLKGAAAALVSAALAGGAAAFLLKDKPSAVAPADPKVIDNTKGTGVKYETQLIPPGDDK